MREKNILFKPLVMSLHYKRFKVFLDITHLLIKLVLCHVGITTYLHFQGTDRFSQEVNLKTDFIFLKDCCSKASELVCTLAQTKKKDSQRVTTFKFQLY